MLLDWILRTLLGDAGGGPSVGGFVLFAVQLLIVVIQLVLIGRARRYALEAERWAMRAEESSRITRNKEER